jgi:osmotically-inducible protein OsmY
MEPNLSSFPIPMDRPSFVPHQEIALAATDRLSRSPYRSVRGISCEFHRGVLFLRGRLPSYYQKQLAQEAVAGLSGVSQVVNEIEVLSRACL